MAADHFQSQIIEHLAEFPCLPSVELPVYVVGMFYIFPAHVLKLCQGSQRIFGHLLAD